MGSLPEPSKSTRQAKKGSPRRTGSTFFDRFGVFFGVIQCSVFCCFEVLFFKRFFLSFWSLFGCAFVFMDFENRLFSMVFTYDSAHPDFVEAVFFQTFASVFPYRFSIEFCPCF